MHPRIVGDAAEKRSAYAELAKRETAAGTMVFEVNYGTKSVEVSLSSAAHSRLSAKAAADW